MIGCRPILPRVPLGLQKTNDATTSSHPHLTKGESQRTNYPAPMYALSTSAGPQNRPALSELILPETNWHADLSDQQRFSRNLSKRTGRPNLLKTRKMILKTPKMFVRFKQLPSMICGGRLGAETNWPAEVAENQGLDFNLGKRTGRPKLMSHQELILRRPEMFVRCQIAPINELDRAATRANSLSIRRSAFHG